MSSVLDTANMRADRILAEPGLCWTKPAYIRIPMRCTDRVRPPSLPYFTPALCARSREGRMAWAGAPQAPVGRYVLVRHRHMARPAVDLKSQSPRRPPPGAGVERLRLCDALHDRGGVGSREAHSRFSSAVQAA